MAVTEATSSCTLETNPLFQINNPTTFTVYELFICPKVKYYNFLRKQEVMWPFNIIKI
jgi:hypothetical protein